jgi:hypothetical protein
MYLHTHDLKSEMSVLPLLAWNQKALESRKVSFELLSNDIIARGPRLP